MRVAISTAVSFLESYFDGLPGWERVRFQETSDPLVIGMYRGLGRGMECALVRINAPLFQTDMGRGMEDIRDQAETAVWKWNLPLPVGIAGKWRKFGRAYA